MYMSKEGRELKKSYILQIQNQYKLPLRTDDIEIEIRLYFHNKLRRDVDNWGKILLDSLTGIVWKDDSQIQRMTVIKGFDKLNPRIEIDIYEK